jgi:hypothetical protein
VRLCNTCIQIPLLHSEEDREKPDCGRQHAEARYVLEGDLEESGLGLSSYFCSRGRAAGGSQLARNAVEKKEVVEGGGRREASQLPGTACSCY